MKVLITLEIAGDNLGPFNLYSNVDGYVIPFEIGLAKVFLVEGYTSILVPTGTTIIKVNSTGICTNSISIPVTLLPITSTTSTSTSTTIQPTTSTTSSTSTSTVVPTTTIAPTTSTSSTTSSTSTSTSTIAPTTSTSTTSTTTEVVLDCTLEGTCSII